MTCRQNLAEYREFQDAQEKEQREAREAAALNVWTRTHQYLLSTHQLPGIYNSPHRPYANITIESYARTSSTYSACTRYQGYGVQLAVSRVRQYQSLSRNTMHIKLHWFRLSMSSSIAVVNIHISPKNRGTSGRGLEIPVQSVEYVLLY